MVCSIIDLRCVVVNELIGSVIGALLIFSLFYFIAASKLRFGFDLTIFLYVPFITILGFYLSGSSLIYAVVTFVAAVMFAWLLNRIAGNR